MMSFSGERFVLFIWLFSLILLPKYMFFLLIYQPEENVVSFTYLCFPKIKLFQNNYRKKKEAI